MSTFQKYSAVSPMVRLVGFVAACALQSAYVSAQTLPTLPAPPPPEPSTHINVLNPPYSAAGNGSTKDTTAIQNALNAAGAISGGAVVDCPGGHTYLIGSISIPSNVWLNVESGATLQGSNTASDYPLTTERWQGNDVSCHRGLVAADSATNIAVIGSGTINGGSSVGSLRSPRGPALFEPRHCRGVLLENVKVANHNVWTLHPTFCQDITFSGVTINSSGGNSDGIDPDSCTRMLIDHCTLTSGDDDIAIKSGKGTEGATVGIPTTDLTITNNTFITGAASCTFGSECSGGVARVLLQNNTFGKGRSGLYFKTVEGRAGYYCDITADTNTYPEQVLEVNSAYAQNSDPHPVGGLAGVTRFNNITVRNATVHSSTDLVKLVGDAKIDVNNVAFSNWTGSAGSGIAISNATNVTVGTGTINVSGGSGLSQSNVTAGLNISPNLAAVFFGGGTASYSLTSQALSGTATLSVEGDGVTNGLPAGTTASFSPSSISGTSGSSTLTITTSASTPIGTYCIVIQATAGSAAHTAAVTLLVVPPEGLRAAAPIFNPPGGSYTSPQSVSISTTSAGAIIHYTTDGSTPSETHGTVYTPGTAVNISNTTTLQAMAYGNGFLDSSITSAVYNIEGIVAAPTFNPPGGTYFTPQNVTIATTTTNASIRYTTDGSTPSEINGLLYSGPVNINLPSTLLQAIAYASGATDSPITSATYLIGDKVMVSAPVFTPVGGTYTVAQNVSMSTATSGATINYTTDGSTPTETHGTAYPGTAVNISSTTVLQAIAYIINPGFTDSTITSATYTIGTPQTFNFEAASMSPVGTGATVSTANDPNVTGGLLEFLNSTAVGQSITLTTPSIPAGTYQVQFRYKTNTSRAQHNVVIDGSQVGGTIDQYATTQTYPTATLSTVTFASAGPHTIVLTVTGKDAAATHFYISADKFTFVGQ